MNKLLTRVSNPSPAGHKLYLCGVKCVDIHVFSPFRVICTLGAQLAHINMLLESVGKYLAVHVFVETY